MKICYVYKKRLIMKTLRRISWLMAALLVSLAASGQRSLPRPGGTAGGAWGGSSLPAPGGVAPSNTWGGSWGNPWNNAWNSPGWGVSVGAGPAWQNQGTANVLACGYDAQGVWRVIPLQVSYNYNGLQYNVTVLNAWNPWSDMWNYGVDQPAYNTSYYLRGTNFSFYTPLSTGTYYFNI